MKGRVFRYLLEPVWVLAVAAYFLNRLWLSPQWGERIPFLTEYFSDLLLIPCALPCLLLLQRAAGLRTHDRSPSIKEIAGVWLLWSVLFEFVFPSAFGLGVADAMDVVAYAGGALFAMIWWAGLPSSTSRRSGKTKNPLLNMRSGFL